MPVWGKIGEVMNAASRTHWAIENSLLPQMALDGFESVGAGQIHQRGHQGKT
jgi:hypothetical protein